jgi:hypothetical protein
VAVGAGVAVAAAILVSGDGVAGGVAWQAHKSRLMNPRIKDTDKVGSNHLIRFIQIILFRIK